MLQQSFLLWVVMKDGLVVLSFYLFLPITLLLYFIVPRRVRNFILLLVSLVFYAWGEPIYVVLMIFSTIVDFIHGLLVEKYQDQPKRQSVWYYPQ